MRQRYTRNTKLPPGQRFNIEPIREQIRLRGMSMRQVAERAGVNHSTLSKTIDKGISPRPDILAKVAKVFGLSMVSLIEEVVTK